MVYLLVNGQICRLSGILGQFSRCLTSPRILTAVSLPRSTKPRWMRLWRTMGCHCGECRGQYRGYRNQYRGHSSATADIAALQTPPRFRIYADGLKVADLETGLLWERKAGIPTGGINRTTSSPCTDVRTPAEYATGHIPGAVNFYHITFAILAAGLFLAYLRQWPEQFRGDRA